MEKSVLMGIEPMTFITWAKLSTHDTQIGNNFIPTDTTAMVNMLLITHDQQVWSKQKLFKPKRFLKDEDVPLQGLILG